MQDDSSQPDITVADMDNAPSVTPPTDTDVVVSKSDLTNALARVSDENEQLKQDLEAAQKKIRTTFARITVKRKPESVAALSGLSNQPLGGGFFVNSRSTFCIPSVLSQAPTNGSNKELCRWQAIERRVYG